MIVGLLLTLAQLPSQIGLPGPFIDPRIQVVPYSPDQVVTLRVGAGYAAVLELAPDERIENVVVGNSAGWQVTPNRRGDHLIVKPLASAATTNMVVITDARRYVMLLQPEDGGNAPFVVRFTYPDAQPVELGKSVDQVATYRLRGTKALFPIAMSDDGRRTRITWAPGIDLPAIFAVDARGKEGLVNGRMVAGDYVVESVAPRFVFRLGNDRATASRRLAKQARRP